MRWILVLTNSDWASILVPLDLEVGVGDGLQLALKVAVLALTHVVEALRLGDEARLDVDNLLHHFLLLVPGGVLQVLHLLHSVLLL